MNDQYHYWFVQSEKSNLYRKNVALHATVGKKPGPLSMTKEGHALIKQVIEEGLRQIALVAHDSGFDIFESISDRCAVINMTGCDLKSYHLTFGIKKQVQLHPLNQLALPKYLNMKMPLDSPQFEVILWIVPLS